MAYPLLLLGLLHGAEAASFQLQSSYVGTDFFSDDKWSFFSDQDPTSGAVKYVDKATALSLGLVNATQDKVFIGADTSSALQNAGRNSVRIESKQNWTSGMFVLTVDHQPSGCGVWPAWWLLGIDASHPWPVWGEIDIVEGAHAQSRVFTTLHTNTSCDQSSEIPGKDFTGAWNTAAGGNPADNCDIHTQDQDSNQGCSQVGPEDSMGATFNRHGGGTFAIDWDPSVGISAYFFKAGREPVDLKAKDPQPEAWGQPYSRFRFDDTKCPRNYFQNLHMIMNIDFCGQWGEKPEEAFHKACPNVPATTTCAEYVQNNPDELKDAYWSFSVLDVYQRVTQTSIVV